MSFKSSNYLALFGYKSIHFWNVSNEVLGRIQGINYIYVNNKEKHNEYLRSNPQFAKQRFISLYLVEECLISYFSMGLLTYNFSLIMGWSGNLTMEIKKCVQCRPQQKLEDLFM